MRVRYVGTVVRVRVRYVGTVVRCGCGTWVRLCGAGCGTWVRCIGAVVGAGSVYRCERVPVAGVCAVCGYVLLVRVWWSDPILDLVDRF